MNEIDLYVDLLDEATANKILKEFSETVPGFSKKANLKQKKIHIRNIFRGQTSKVRNYKGGQRSPFYIHLNKFKNQQNDSYFGEVGSEILFRMLSLNNEIPEYYKLAIALKYQPEELFLILPDLVRNYEKSIPIFASYSVFETNQEAVDYLKATSEYLKENAFEKFLDNLLKGPMQSDESNYEFIIKEVAPLSLGEFINKKKDYKPIPDYLLYFSYLKTHPDLSEDIRIGMLLYATEQLVINKDEKVSVLAKKINENNKELHDEVIEENAKMKSLIKVLQSQITDFELMNDKFQKEVSRTEQIKKDFETEKKELLQFHLKNEDNINSLNKEITEMNNILKATQNELNLSNEKLTYFQNEFRAEENNDRIAVICAENNDFLKVFYSEIFQSTHDKWEIEKEKLTKYSFIYIQRDGLDSNMIYNMSEFCKKNNLNYSYFIAKGTKEIIERIAYHKLNLMEVQ
ncbi:hypothetical protein [Paenibacillus sp. FSL R7-0026]|uniref:hypothetical protein n=1 Tax=Paenibacillus sp. FSL R7-0026 TaxID=2921668 RepID=UPI0030FA3269